MCSFSLPSTVCTSHRRVRGTEFWRTLLQAYKGCHAGTAGIEFALVAGTLCLIMLNAFDLANYIYKRMQVENAAQMGAQAAWKTCDPTMLPATKLCAGLNAAVTAAVQSTSLGQGVTLEPGSLSEGYLCLDLSGSLKPVGTLNVRPVDCSATSMPNLQPGNYIIVSVTYSYTSIFSDLTVTRFFGTSIQSTSYMRLL
jgi:Flp pilus assembly protein TadG